MYTFIISKDSTGNTVAYNNITKTIQFTNSRPSVVFNSALAYGGRIGLKNGIYEIDDNIIPKNCSVFEGESMDKTIIRAKAGFNDNTLFRYWMGASSVPLQGFKLKNLKLELNVNNATDAAWISSGTNALEVDHVWVKSVKNPTISRIGFFIDNAQGTNNNVNLKIHDCTFEGPCLEQDMLGLGNVVNGDVSNNLFLNNSAQAVGIGSIYQSEICHNRFVNTGNAVGLEWKCENNLISENECWNTTGIKLSGGWEKNSINYSRNNKCVNNIFSYGEGGIEAGISIDDEISGNKFYRTERNGIQGSFLRCVVDNNIFTDTNYGNHSDGLVGNNTQARTGGIIAYNSNSNMMLKNEWNSFCNNTFMKSGVKFGQMPDQAAPPTNLQNQQGYTNGIVIDTKYTNSYVSPRKGNLGVDLLKNFGTLAS